MTDKFRPLKNAFGRFATGIGVAACSNENGGFTAMTINSFTSVSLEPPLVLWCIERNAMAAPAFLAAASYSVSILSAEQRSMSDRFARYGLDPMKDDEVDLGPSGAPLLKGRIAGFDCAVASRHTAGDHIILVGEVTHFDSADGAPLIYFASNYFSNPEKI